MLKLDVYGDESCGISAITYGVLIVPRPLRSKLEHRLALAKLSFGGRVWDELHCNQLMNEADRASGPWSHLRYEDIFALLERICTDLQELRTQQAVCVFDRKNGATLSDAFAQPWTDGSGNESEPSPADTLAPGDKGIAVLCAHGLLRALLDGLGPSPVTFIPDPDGDSRIAWGSEIKRVRELLAQGSFDTRGKFRYVAVRAPKPPLLQLADLVAYVAQRACRDSQSETTKRFQSLAARIVTSTYQFRP